MKRAARIALPPLTFDRRRPLAPQVATALRIAIRTGRLRSGDRVPSTRVLAREIGVSRQVVVGAYEELVLTGELDGRTGDGSYVAAQPPIRMPAPLKKLHDPDGQAIQIFPLDC